MSMLSSLRESAAPAVAVEIAADRVSAASLEWRGGQPVVAAHASERLPDGALVPSLTAVNAHDRAAVLGAGFLWYAWKLLDPPDEFFAMRTFKYSIVYLMALFAFLLLDHWLLPFLQPGAGVGFVPAS